MSHLSLGHSEALESLRSLCCRAQKGSRFVKCSQSACAPSLQADWTPGWSESRYATGLGILWCGWFFHAPPTCDDIARPGKSRAWLRVAQRWAQWVCVEWSRGGYLGIRRDSPHALLLWRAPKEGLIGMLFLSPRECRSAVYAAGCLLRDIRQQVRLKGVQWSTSRRNRARVCRTIVYCVVGRAKRVSCVARPIANLIGQCLDDASYVDQVPAAWLEQPSSLALSAMLEKRDGASMPATAGLYMFDRSAPMWLRKASSQRALWRFELGSLIDALYL